MNIYNSSNSPYVTEHFLDSSTCLRFRPVTPADKPRFASEFTQLSDETRYRRCFSFRKELTSTELDMLCNVDGTSHVAIVVVSLDENGDENEGVGGARFIRSDSDSKEAEMAFLIVDSWQHKHVGQLLLLNLIDNAGANGVHSLRCEVMTDNQNARRLLRNVAHHSGWTIDFDLEGATLYRPEKLDSAPATIAAIRAVA